MLMSHRQSRKTVRDIVANYVNAIEIPGLQEYAVRRRSVYVQSESPALGISSWRPAALVVLAAVVLVFLANIPSVVAQVQRVLQAFVVVQGRTVPVDIRSVNIDQARADMPFFVVAPAAIPPGLQMSINEMRPPTASHAGANLIIQFTDASGKPALTIAERSVADGPPAQSGARLSDKWSAAPDGRWRWTDRIEGWAAAGGGAPHGGPFFMQVRGSGSTVGTRITITPISWVAHGTRIDLISYTWVAHFCADHGDSRSDVEVGAVAMFVSKPDTTAIAGDDCTSEVPERLARWKNLVIEAKTNGLLQDAVMQVQFRNAPAVRDELEALVAAEQKSCPFLRLDVAENKNQLVLTITSLLDTSTTGYLATLAPVLEIVCLPQSSA